MKLTVLTFALFASLSSFATVKVQLPNDGRFIVTVTGPANCMSNRYELVSKSYDLIVENGATSKHIDVKLKAPRSKSPIAIATVCYSNATYSAVGFFETRSSNVLSIDVKSIFANPEDAQVKIERVLETAEEI